MTEIEKKNIKNFVNLFDKLLKKYAITKKDLVFNTSWARTKDQKKEVKRSVNRYKKERDSIIKDIVL